MTPNPAREKMRTDAKEEAAAQARACALKTKMSHNCWVATRRGWPLSEHSPTCIGVRQPSACLCVCHDRPAGSVPGENTEQGATE